MPPAIRTCLIALSLTFFVMGGYYRVQSQRAGERLNRTKEGWPLLIGIRLMGFVMLGSTAVWLSKPSLFTWAAWPVPMIVQWTGVVGFAFAVSWLLWMFHTLGRNLTDTVVVRRDAYLVTNGPYGLVRNPMYTGILMVGAALGLALGTWLVPVAAVGMFGLLATRLRREEKYLVERFGDEYLNYMKCVGRFFPRIWQDE